MLPKCFMVHEIFGVFAQKNSVLDCALAMRRASASRLMRICSGRTLRHPFSPAAMPRHTEPVVASAHLAR